MPNFKSERILAEAAKNLEPRNGILPLVRADNLQKFGVVVPGRFMSETWIDLITRLGAKRFDMGDWDRPKTVWMFNQSDIGAVRMVVPILDASDIVKPVRLSKAALRRMALAQGGRSGDAGGRDEDDDDDDNDPDSDSGNDPLSALDALISP